MRLAKVLLIVHSLVTLGFGSTLLVNPTEIAEYMGLIIATSDGKAELVTMYVGMSGAMSLFMLYGAFNEKWLDQATLFLFLSMSGIAVSRVLGFVFFETGSYTLNALIYDVPITLLSGFAFKNIPKQ